jgi:LmbE family N-acetylglucosaminyl deacetylase
VVTAGFDHRAPGTPRSAWEACRGWQEAPVWNPAEGPATVVVLAAHPDDESLGAGGAIARLSRRGWRVEVVVATDGEGSHPGSPTLAPHDLAALRRREAEAAVGRLGSGIRLHHLGLPDGDLAAHEDDLVARLVELVGDGAHHTLLAPWRHDPHPDHRAAGRAAHQTAYRTDALLLEYPVWAWHQLAPTDLPWPLAVRLELTADEQQRKAAAVAAHATQVHPLSADPRDSPVVTPAMLAHFSGPHETFFVADGVPPPTPFDALHGRSADPWQVDESWYERRKRSVLLASLPHQHYASALEVGCSVGALTADLATRCTEVTALDVSAAAVARARERLAGHAHVRVEQRTVPEELPPGPFDLVLLSEVGYFLSPGQLRATVAALPSLTASSGVVVACHWLHPIVGWPLDGASVHRALRAALGRPAVRHVESDFLLEVWDGTGR